MRPGRGTRNVKGQPIINSLTVPFWAAAQEQRLVVQVDQTTGQPQFYPRPIGLGSGAQTLQWTTATGDGHIVAVTLLPGKTGAPTLLALVQLDEGVRLLATIIAKPEDARIGGRTRIVWRARPDAPPMFAFVPA